VRIRAPAADEPDELRRRYAEIARLCAEAGALELAASFIQNHRSVAYVRRCLFPAPQLCARQDDHR